MEKNMNLRNGALLFLAAATLACGPTIVLAQGPPPPGDNQSWENPPAEFREAQTKGYHDGVEGARKDFDNHRRPDVNNRDEYKHPHVSAADRDDYRDGFRNGYQAGVDHIMHEHQ
jgi:ribosome modulation factor